jgi:S1-C subfamily serine protease
MNVMNRLRTRILLFVVLALLGVGVLTGLAFARSKAPVGTGVVVVTTKLIGGAAAGTGMVLTSSGEVLTNNHVINGATTIKVTVPSGGRTYTGHVVGYDVSDDVAVIQLQGASNLKTVSTSSARAFVGQSVRAVGNAGGSGRLTSASGKVTGVGRTITASDDQGESELLTGLIETNAGVQAGDSGGPLVDSAGRVLGMTTAASSSGGFQFQNVAATDAYAIPITKALPIAQKIEAGNASARIHIGSTAFLGVALSPTDTGAFGDGSASGAAIAAVVPGGPADSAGLSAGDLITRIDGRTISSPTTVRNLLLTKKPGTNVSVTFVDQFGNSQTTTVTLGSGPPR